MAPTICGMETLIAVSLLAIAGILFHRLVDRRHKTLFGKVLAGILALTIVSLGVALAWAQRNDSRAEARKRSVRITYQLDKPSLDTLEGVQSLRAMIDLLSDDTVDHARFELCNVGSDTVTRVTFSPITLREAGRASIRCR